MAPPEHRGLRPLGPYGEGYCRVCHFVIALLSTGQLEEHSRGASMAVPKLCKGGRKTPPRVTPDRSYKAAFKVIAPTAECPYCPNNPMVMPDGRLNPHRPSLRSTENCRGSFRPVGYRPPVVEPVNLSRNHSAERG